MEVRMTDLDLQRRSVTKNDTGDTGVIHFIVGNPALQLAGVDQTLLPGLPDQWSHARDAVLLGTLRMLGLWASVINKAVTKQVALGWTVSDTKDIQARTERLQDILHGADGSNWVSFGQRHLQSMYLTDNGCFVEIVRSARAPGSRILGLMHLDSLRCRRTGDPQRPVIYTDSQGQEHELRADDVLCYADMPRQDVESRGVGLCAASRAFQAILKLAAVESYFRDKVSGRNPKAIHIINGLTAPQLEKALITAKVDAQNKNGNGANGGVTYMGSIVIPVLDTSLSASIVTIPLAEIPDGFEVQTEREAAMLEMVNAVGMPIQDVKPLSGQGLGTGTQTIIQDEAAEAMGPAVAWRKWWTYAMNNRISAKTTTFTFATNDVRDQKAKAELANLRATERATRIASGELTPQQAQQLALDAGDLPKELAPSDETAGGQVTDTEKVAEADTVQQQQPQPTPQPLVTPRQPVVDVVKAWDLYEEAMG
jgi:hypothetical protein